MQAAVEARDLLRDRRTGEVATVDQPGVRQSRRRMDEPGEHAPRATGRAPRGVAVGHSVQLPANRRHCCP